MVNHTFSILKRQYQKLRAWRDLVAITPANDPKLDAYGDYAYRKCIDWFGPVPDSHWTWEINYALFEGLVKSLLFISYMIVIWRNSETDAERYEVIGHEMYHRVTLARKGLNQIYWVDEMLAILTSMHLLSDFSQRPYTHLLKQVYQRQDALSLKELSALPSPPRSKRYTTDLSDSFLAGLSKIGTALEKIIGWDHLCRLVHCQTWDQWLSQLPDGMRQEAHRLLLPAIDPSAIIPFDASDIKLFGGQKSRSKYPNPIIIDKPKIDQRYLKPKHRRNTSGYS